MKTLHLVTLFTTTLLLSACGGSSATSGVGQSSTPEANSSSSRDTSSSSSTVSESSASSESSETSNSSSSATSSSSSSESSDVEPLAEGAGIYTTSWLQGDTYLIDGETGEIALQANPLHFLYSAADIGPGGFVIASMRNDVEIRRVDLMNGRSEVLFSAPEAIESIAVNAEGVIVGISEEEEFDQKTVYRFDMKGEILSTATTDVKPSGIDFMPDGSLLAISLIDTDVLDAETGEATPLFETFNNPFIGTLSDIDIDSDGVLRAFSGVELVLYNMNTGAEIEAVTLQQDLFSFSPLVYR